MTTGDKNDELGKLLENFDIHVHGFFFCLFILVFGGREDREGIVWGARNTLSWEAKEEYMLTLLNEWELYQSYVTLEMLEVL